MSKDIISKEVIDKRIYLIRGQRVMIDSDLAELYGVKTKRLNEQVKRNKERFPTDFMFRLSKKERDEVVAICDRFNRLKYSTVLPNGFTEHGAIMAANVLNSQKAVRTSILVVRAFARIRNLLVSHKTLAVKLEKLENKYDSQFRVVFDAIRKLMEPSPKSKRKIGF